MLPEKARPASQTPAGGRAAPDSLPGQGRVPAAEETAPCCRLAAPGLSASAAAA